MADSPKILSKRDVFTCPWITLVESEVRLTEPKERNEYFYAIRQSDYVSVVAQLEDGRLPLVRQYRPAVDAYTLELPAGTVEKGETPEHAGIREIREEVGMESTEVVNLGSYYADTGRLSNRQHVYLIRGKELKNVEREPGIEVVYRTKEQIQQAIKTGEFSHQLHVGAFLLALPYLK